VHTDVLVGRIAARQLGLITRRQALDAGITPGEIRWRAATGRWNVIRFGVFAVAGAPPSWEQRVLAAVLAGPPGTVASHFSAASSTPFRTSSEMASM
jgi:hypothetical protein